MKRIFLLLFLFAFVHTSYGQLNASQIKKDGVTVIGNAQNKLAVDTVTTIPTKDWVLNNTSGGGGGTWGSITGALSNQTDLQSALNAKLSLSDTASMLTRYLRSNAATLLYEPIISAGTTGQYWRGDKSWQTLNSTAVGLGNVPNLDATNPSNTVQTSSFRFVTDAEKSTWNAKQSAITTGTTLQYFRGDLSLATFPTNVSSFTNDAGYITSSGVTPAALTKVDDTNVTLTLGGTPSTALLQAASITAGWTGTLADGRIASASTWNAKESALTFSTGLTRSTNTITVNTSQNIATLSNLTSNGFVKTSGGTGALSIDGNTYFNVSNNLSEGTAATMRTNLGLGTLATQSGTFSGTSSGTNTGDQTITLTGNVTGSGTGSFATTIANSAVTNAMLAGSIDLTAKVTGALPIANGGTASTTAAGARASLLTMFPVVMVNTVGTLVQNTTYYFGAPGNAANTTANRRFKKIPFACTLRGATITMVSSNSPSTENNTVVLSINNGATNVTISSAFASGGSNCTSTHYTGFSQALGDGDTIEIKYTTNATLATAPANCGLVVDLYFE